MVTLEELDESTWQAFLNAPISVLMLSKNDCPSCLQLSKELTDWEYIEAVHANIRFGKIMLDRSGMGRFKIAQPWVSNIDIMPFLAIFVDGERVMEWGGRTRSYLQNQLEVILG